MTGATRRLQSLVDVYGETFTIGASSHHGVFSNVTVGTDKSYMSSGEVDAAGVPLFVCLVRNDDTSALNDTLTWNGKNFVVKRVLEARFRGEVSAKMLVLAQGLAVG